jgi:hypothetical protein
MDEVLACRPLGPKPIRGPNIGDRRSISRAELQITVTVDCLDADLVLFALPVHGQLDRDPGCAPAPQCAIEVRQIANLRPVDRDDPIAMLDSRAGSRAFRSDAAHHELTTDLLQIGAEPRPRRGRTAERKTPRPDSVSKPMIFARLARPAAVVTSAAIASVMR